MVRLKNKKYTTATLAASATIQTDDGRVVRANAGDIVLTDTDGKRYVKTPAQYAADHEIVSGTVRDKSVAFTTQTPVGRATVTTSDGLVQQSVAGDILVTNSSTGEVRVVKPTDYVQQYE